MQSKIKLQIAQNISGVGTILQFTVLEGVIRAGMKTGFYGKTLTIGNRIVAYENAIEAERALHITNTAIKYRLVKEAKAGDGVIQTVLLGLPENGIQFLSQNKEGIFTFTDD